MNSEWNTHRLADLATFKYGKFLAKSDLSNNGFPVFSGYGIVGYLPAYQFDTPQLIIVCRGEGGTGDVKMSPPKCSITNLSIVVSENIVKVRKDFLYWALKASDTHRLRTGSAQAQIVIGSLANLTISVPASKTLQENIAKILTSLDDRITLLRETNTTLEAIAQTLFKSWFVDFDPVRAKQQGREPEGMDADTAALFPGSFEESERGLVPRGWRVGPILDIARLLSGGTPKTDRPEYWGGGIAWASAKDVSQSGDSVLVETDRTITQRGLEESATRIIPALSSVVVARGATTGRMVLLGNAMAMNQTCYALESKTATPIALYCQLRREIDILVNAAHGSVFDTITTSTFAQSKVVQPVQPLLKHFEGLVAPLFQQILVGTRASRTLATIRDTLLPRLISGQLRLPEAETQMARTAA